MRTQSIQQVSSGLLAHLHLSASEAAVMVDDIENPSRLVVHIYDDEAARRVKRLSSWQGLQVKFVSGAVGPQRSKGSS